jgi:hypothetical protein
MFNKYCIIGKRILTYLCIFILFLMVQQPMAGRWLLTITQTDHARQDSSGRGIGLRQRPLPDNTQHSQETDSHASDVIRNLNPSKRTAPDPLLRPRGHWDRHI